MPTVVVTVQVAVTVADLKPETIGAVMCDVAAGAMSADAENHAEMATIIKVETYEN